MKSSIWHVGINRSLEDRFKKHGWLSPRIATDGSIPWVPLPGHDDPDLVNRTYGEPWGRIDKLRRYDVAFFIESGTKPDGSWAFYIIAAFSTETVYKMRRGRWDCTPTDEHMARTTHNAHYTRGDTEWSILLGMEGMMSRVMLNAPFPISSGQVPLPRIVKALGLDPAKKHVGYWWKRWLDDEAMNNLLRLAASPIARLRRASLRRNSTGAVLART